MDEHAKKVAREELNEPEDAASALAAFSASVVEALGAAEELLEADLAVAVVENVEECEDLEGELGRS